MAEYMCDVNGNYYKIGVTYTSGSENNNNTYCAVKGDNIPILEWARNEWRSIAEDEADWFYVYGNAYASGRVMFLSEPIEENGVEYIYAICFFWHNPSSSNSPSYSQRVAMTTYPCDFFIATVRQKYHEQYDYRHFCINRHLGSYPTYTYTWLPNFGSSSYETSVEYVGTGVGNFRTDLTNVIDWQDGQGGGTVHLKTLMIPHVYMLYYQGDGQYMEWTQACLSCIIDTDDPDGNYYKDYSWLAVGETPDQKFLLYESFAGYKGSNGLPVRGAGYGIKLSDFTSGYEPYNPPSEYPFEDDYNDGGGGTGDYRDTSDTIPQDGVPSVSALSTGFVRAYELSNSQINDLYTYLMSNNFLDNVKKLMSDPIDYIISLMLAPYTPEIGSQTTVKVGGVDTGINALPIISGYKNIDCGTIELREFWGKFLDYNPYTKVQIYLPFIGIKPLDIDDVMSAQIALTYRIDVLTGACVATVAVDNTRGTNGAIYYFNGNCHNHIPVSGKNYLDILSNVMRVGSGLAGAISQSSPLGVATSTIDIMRSSREIIEHAGELQGSHGLLSNFTPFLIVSRPSQSLAQNFKHYRGYVSNVTKQLGELTGYTEVAELVQTDIHCTLDEFEEINTLLKEGVYL